MHVSLVEKLNAKIGHESSLFRLDRERLASEYRTFGTFAIERAKAMSRSSRSMSKLSGVVQGGYHQKGDAIEAYNKEIEDTVRKTTELLSKLRGKIAAKDGLLLSNLNDHPGTFSDVSDPLYVKVQEFFTELEQRFDRLLAESKAVSEEIGVKTTELKGELDILDRAEQLVLSKKPGKSPIAKTAFDTILRVIEEYNKMFAMTQNWTREWNAMYRSLEMRLESVIARL